MSDLFNEDGEIVEGALSPEEVQEKLKESADELESAKTEAEETVSDLQDQLTEKQEELEKEQGKDKNFSKLRDKQKGKDEAIEKLTGEIDSLKESIQGVKKDGVTDAIGKVARGDKELADKIKFHYDSFSGEADTPEKIAERISNANILATGGQPVNPLSGAAIASGGADLPAVNPTGEKISEDGKEIAKKLGITDAELKKSNLI